MAGSGGGAKPVVVADLEGTLTTGETWRGIAAWLRARRGSDGSRAFVARRLAWIALDRAGLIDRQAFRDAWIRDFARLLAGLPWPEIGEAAEWVVDHELWPKRRRHVVDEVLSLGAGGYRLVLASGTYEPFLRAFAERVGAEALGTVLEMRDGRATGGIDGGVGTGTTKAARVRVALDGVPPARAYGDSAADIPMLEASRTPVAVHPDGRLARTAAERGWRIITGPPAAADD
jgi:phosphoserine phosphatase